MRRNILGPGLLLAGAAIGVSHLVQSTRAGAVYGLGLVALVVLANVVKYPAFRFGPQYAAATGTSLLEGYRRQGRWALWLYLLLTLGTMFTVQAAVALTTAGLGQVVLGLPGTPTALAVGLVALCAGLLGVGRYRWLDAINKWVVAVLTLSTLAATALLVPQIDWAGLGPTLLAPPRQGGLADLAFAAALVGWMPSAIDVSVWHSLWTLARKQQTGDAPTVAEAVSDFHLGYWGTALLALCFVLLGAGVMYGKGLSFPESAVAFSAQIIDLYAAALGDWARPVIGTCAFAVMFSTTLTVVDGFPRGLAVLTRRLREPEQPFTADDGHPGFRRAYWASLALLSLGSLVLIGLLVDRLKVLVDVATTLSFLTAPGLAWLNHRAICAEHVPAAARPGPALRRFSALCNLLLLAFALGYLWLRWLA